VSDITISLRNIDEERTLFGHLDRNLRILRDSYEIDAVSRGGRLTLSGTPAKTQGAARAVEAALEMIRNDGATADRIAGIFKGDDPAEENGNGSAPHGIRYAAKPRTPNQQKYMEAIRDHDVTFGLGPAGTGKTYLAVAMAVSLVKSGLYRRIVLVRPAVEAGESLGFLPGSLEAKIDPYVRPLYDALDELLPRGSLKRLVDEGVIEISPLAYMRGRTLNNCVIILDEAQNASIAQMKMFLTRMGMHSKVIVTGDTTQIDLPRDQPSGLLHVLRVLDGVESMKFCHLKQEDIARHPVVQNIVRAFGVWEERVRQEASRGRKSGRTPDRKSNGEHDRGRKGRRRS